jgi:signal transduction histidine kinase
MAGGDQAQIQKRIARAIELARENLHEARRTIVDLRSEPLEGISLVQALEKLATDAQREYGLKAEIRGPAAVDRFSARVESTLYRIAQEAIVNIRKHAGASRVRIELTPCDDHLCLSIVDDGHGFDPAAVRSRADGGFGLRGMSERASLLGGELIVDSQPGRGTRIQVSVPMVGQVVRLPSKSNGNGQGH